MLRADRGKRAPTRSREVAAQGGAGRGRSVPAAPQCHPAPASASVLARKEAAAWNRRAVAAIASGDLVTGKASLERALALDPQRAGTWTSLATLRIERGELQEAEQACRRALALIDPAPSELWQLLGTIAFRRQAFARAERCFAKAIKAGSEDSGLCASHAAALLYSGRFERARCAFEAAAKAEPRYMAPGTIGDFAALICEILGGRARTGFEHRFARMPTGAQERVFRAALLLLQRFGYHAEGQLVARLWVERFPASEAARHFAGAARGARCKRASPSFLIEHFDDYAERFDRHVVDELGYRVPEALGALLGGTLPARQDLEVLDAGCGTGLCAPWLRPIARRLVGVDLSANMLEQARRRRLYDALVEGDLVAFLARAPAAWDVVIAADVLIYLGDLAPLATALAGALRENGRFAFSIEDLAGDRDWDLKPGGRFAHSSSYVRRVFGKGFNEAHRMEIGLRKEGGTYVRGKLFVLQKR